MKFSVLSRALFSAAALVVFVAGLRAAGSIIVPFLLACFLAVITSPIMVALRKRGIRPLFSVFLLLFAITTLLWAVVQVANTSITEMGRNSELYQLNLRRISLDWVAWLRSKGIEVNSDTFNSLINPANLMRWVVNNLTLFLRGVLTNAFLIILTTVFLLFELAGLPNKLRLALGPEHPSVPGMERFTGVLNRYLAIKSWISLATGLCAFLFCRLLGIGFAHLWGLLAFLLNYIPNIGSILAAVPPVLLALVEKGTPASLTCIAGYLVINILFGNIVEPRVMGRGLGLSTLVVWMSLIFWGWVFGPVGMLLSVPLTMVVKIAMESNPETHWIAVLLGADPGPNAAFEPRETAS